MLLKMLLIKMNPHLMTTIFAFRDKKYPKDPEIRPKKQTTPHQIPRNADRLGMGQRILRE